jgi:ABC-type phosphate transport system substrate-binding protein
MSKKSFIRAGFAAAGMATVLAMVPAGANAAFDANHDAQCENAASISGIGASFQLNAQVAWGAATGPFDTTNPAPASGFGYAPAAAGGCSAFTVGGQRVTYQPAGSGDGRNAFGATAGVRNTRYAFGGADEPHNPTQLTAANNGPDGVAGGTDDAVLHTIPVAQSAVAVNIQLPTGCAVAESSTARRISKTALAGAFAGSASFDTWGEILPSITGTGCAAKQFKRVVRLDSSGTTFAFKRYLSAVTPAPYAGLGNTAWPADTGATATVRPTSNGAGAQLAALKQQTVNGGIGYADLATSRTEGFDWSGASDSTVWLNVQRLVGTSYASPTATDGVGANCTSVEYRNGGSTTLPTTTASWINVDAVQTEVNYPLCALTYAMAWQQPSKANVGVPAGQPVITQDQARAVKDRLGYILNTTAPSGTLKGGGQTELVAAGYQQLPSLVRTAALTGVDALNY